MHRHIVGILIEFVASWQLLSTIPLPFNTVYQNRPMGWSAMYYPLVGLIFGLLLAGASWFFYFVFPVEIASGLLLVVWIAFSGMLHLDGFMDSCDGLLPPRNPARRLEIMKDSRVGAFGVVGGILLLLLKFNGLTALSPAHRWAALIVIPMLARWAMTWAMARYPLARPDGMGTFFSEGLNFGRVGIASLFACGVTVVVMQWAALFLIVATWFTGFLVSRFAIARIGGLTGDVYGAICELVETVLLFVVVFVAQWQLI